MAANPMIVGMDFGTTNSGVALFDGQVRHFPLDPANRFNPCVVRTVLYISRGGRYYFGRPALDEYFEQNQGRPARLRREYVGEISLTFADLGTFYRDVYVWVDELEPGRLLRSLKTFLQDKDYLGTSVYGQFYTLEDLVATFLLLLKTEVEQQMGEEAEEIVLGRPVRFGDSPEADTLAEERLACAAILAGYRRAYFQLEPVAAALYYQQSTGLAQKILVFDFGGGTLDVTVMELTGPARSQVLSTAGVRVAGDVFDRRIVRARLAKRLGENLTYGEQPLAMPAHIYDDLADWQSMLLLNRPEILNFLADVARQTCHPEQVRALSSIIANNYGLMMFEQVERAKIDLSSRTEAVIRLQGQDLDIEEPLQRGEFEQIIGGEARKIAACLDEALARAQLRHDQIDAVVRTGGSSQIPIFQRMLRARFGAEKIRPLDEFTSVTAGLAIAGRQIAEGSLQLPSYSAEILRGGRSLPAVGEHRSPVLGLRELLRRRARLPRR